MGTRQVVPVLVLAAVLGVGHLFATPSMWPVDETAHISYVDSLTRNWEIPHIDDPLPTGAAAQAIPGLPERLRWERSQLRDGRQDIWVANHPPAAYAVQGIAYRIGRSLGGSSPIAGTLAVGFARATSVLWLVVGVWATAQLAFTLAGASRRKHHRASPEQVALGAALLVAVTPTLSHLAGLAFTDVPAFTTSTLCLLVGVRAALDGVTRRRLTGLGLLIGLTLAVRTSNLPAAGVAALLGLYGWWRTTNLPGGDRLAVRDLLGPFLVSVAAIVPAAVWGLRNVSLYGSFTASEYLLTKFDRDINGLTSQVLLSFDSWLRLATRMMADLTTGHWNTGTRRDAVEIVLTLICGAGLWWLFSTVDEFRQRRRLSETPAPGSAAQPAASHRARLTDVIRSRPLEITWTLLTLVPLTLSIAALQFHAAGGSLHGRYVLSGHAVVIIAATVWLTSLHRHTGWAITVTAGLLLLVDLALIWGIYAEHSSNWDRTTIMIDLPSLAGGSTPVLLGALSVLAAGLFAVVATDLLRYEPASELTPRRPVAIGGSAAEFGDEPIGRVVRIDEPTPNPVQ